MPRFLRWRLRRDDAAARQRMVDEQLVARGIADERVLDAMRRVPRHLFVPPAFRDDAYADTPLPLGVEQTISQPYIVAFMCEALEIAPTHRVLDIGTGSGYQTAVLTLLAREVFSLEIDEGLATSARDRLRSLGYGAAHVRCGDGHAGWPDEAPFDRIVVAAAPAHVPPALVAQLGVGGVMVIPVGTGPQELRVLRRTARGVTSHAALAVRFVPMTGEAARPLPPEV